jgi:TPR repeat protein
VKSLNLLHIFVVALALTLPVSAAVHQHEQQISIEFPDGEPVQIQAKRTPRWRAVEPDGQPLAAVYQSLRSEAASGGGSAAFALAAALNRCHYAYADESSLEAAIEKLRSTGEIVAPGAASAPTPLRPGTDRVRAEEDLFRRPYRFCKGISAAQRLEADFWLKRSAELGYPPAALTIGLRLGRTNEALKMLEIAWQSGRYDAVGHLGKLYELGKIGERAPDPVKGLAHLYIYHRITQARLSGATGPIRSKLFEQSKRDLDLRLTSASPAVREAALRLARTILADNSNCCYGF